MLQEILRVVLHVLAFSQLFTKSSHTTGSQTWSFHMLQTALANKVKAIRAVSCLAVGRSQIWSLFSPIPLNYKRWLATTNKHTLLEVLGSYMKMRYSLFLLINHGYMGIWNCKHLNKTSIRVIGSTKKTLIHIICTRDTPREAGKTTRIKAPILSLIFYLYVCVYIHKYIIYVKCIVQTNN